MYIGEFSSNSYYCVLLLIIWHISLIKGKYYTTQSLMNL